MNATEHNDSLSNNLEYNQQKLQVIADRFLNRSISLGASDAVIEINEVVAKDVNILNNDIDTFELSHEFALSLSTYIGNKVSNITITNINQNIDEIINKSLAITNSMQEDVAHALPELTDLYLSKEPIIDNLQLHNSVSLANTELIEYAKQIEGAALDKNLKSDGVSVNLSEGVFLIANTRGLSGSYYTSRYSSSISLIAQHQESNSMQTDYWYSANRNFKNLITTTELALTAKNRVLRRMNKGEITSGTYPVIFEHTIARQIISSFLNAISGKSVYRKLSFLHDKLNTNIFPSNISIIDDPFVVTGLGSCYFDSEGVSVKPNNLITDGMLNSYLLSSYTARKLNMQTTGNCGGAHNVIVKNTQTGGMHALLKQLNNGVVIIETIGHGINNVTGDFSLGASGLLVTNGEITGFIDNFTIAGNLLELYKNIIAVSDDYHNSSILCGSMLVDKINIIK